MRFDGDTIPDATGRGTAGGEPQAQLVAIHGTATEQTVAIDRPELTIGRQPDNDLVLSSEKVSRRHGRVLRDGAVHFYEDLDSINGTLLNGRRLEPRRRYALHHKDVLQLSDYRLLLLDWAGLAGRLGLATIDLDSEQIRREAEEILEDFR